MVHANARRRRRFYLAQGLAAALALILTSLDAHAALSRALAENIAHIQITEESRVVSRGSGLFLGTIGGRGLLLTAAHVLWAPTQVGAPSSPHSIVLELPGATIEARFAEIEFYGSDSDIEGGLTQKDYIIVSVPIPPHARHRVYNLTPAFFAAPYRSAIEVIGRSRYGLKSATTGRIVGIGNEPVVEFEIKTDDVVEKGDSGSLIIDPSTGVINGVLKSTEEGTSEAIFPENYILDALEDILLANADPEYFVGWSLTVAPTYQIASDVSEIDDGASQSRQKTDSYQSIEIELLGARSIKGKNESPRLGLVFGYSEGAGHALGKYEEVDYTVKGGITWGIASFSEGMSASLGLLLLAHSIDDEIEYEPALSGEIVFSTLKLSPANTLDIGVRMEINELDISGLTDSESSIGFALLFKFSWLGKV